MNRRSYLIPGILLAGMALNAGAQQSAPAAAPAPTPAPLRPIVTLATHPDWPMPKNPSDVDTVDHIVASLYDVISGPSTKPRDWERFRSLFLPDARIGAVLPDTAATKDAPAHKGDAVFLSPDTYAQQDDPYFKTHSFFERGIANRVEEFGASSTCGVRMRAGMRSTTNHSREASIPSRLCMLEGGFGLPASFAMRSDLG